MGNTTDPEQVADDEATKKQRRLAHNIRRLSVMVQDQVAEFQNDGILTDKLRRQAANFSSIIEPLASAFEEVPPKPRPLDKTPRKSEGPSQRRKKKPYEKQRSSDKGKLVQTWSSGNKVQPLKGSHTTLQAKTQKTKDKLQQTTSKPEVATSNTSQKQREKATKKGVDQTKGKKKAATVENVSLAARQLRVTMPAFVVLGEEVIDCKEDRGDKDMGQSCREFCKMPPTADMCIVVPKILSKHKWTLSLISDLPKRPGLVDEDSGDDDYEEELAPTGDERLSSSSHQDAKPPEFAWTPFHDRIEQSPLGYPASVGASREATHYHGSDSKLTIKTDHRPPPTEPKVHILSSTTANDKPHFTAPTPGRKRARSPSPPPQARRRNRVVCLACIRFNCWCTSEVTCGECKANGRRCTYLRCNHDLACSNARCIKVHLGQLNDGEEARMIVDS